MMVLSRRYLTFLLTVIFIFAALPVAAPILMRVGLTAPASLIYSAYSPMCHQFAYRSLFLFGEQPVYPRATVSLPGILSWEAYLPTVMQSLGDRLDQSNLAMETNARNFRGTETMGYKVAVCQRDIGIYWALFFTGLVYSIPRIRRVVRPCPIWLYLLLGLAPIGMDGFSQLFSYLPGFWVVRETTPAFRFITGVLLGVMTGWLAFPYLEAAARETYQEIAVKFARRSLRKAAQ